MNLCNLWKKNYSVCRKCGVHFEPVTGADARWGYLCATHRDPLKKYDLEHDAVMAWAKDNLPKVKKMMDEEIEARQAKWKYLREHTLAELAREQQNSMAPSGQKPGSLYGHHER
jgi:hypothetical protein